MVHQMCARQAHFATLRLFRVRGSAQAQRCKAMACSVMLVLGANMYATIVGNMAVRSWALCSAAHPCGHTVHVCIAVRWCGPSTMEQRARFSCARCLQAAAPAQPCHTVDRPSDSRDRSVGARVEHERDGGAPPTARRDDPGGHALPQGFPACAEPRLGAPPPPARAGARTAVTPPSPAHGTHVERGV